MRNLQPREHSSHGFADDDSSTRAFFCENTTFRDLLIIKLNGNTCLPNHNDNFSHLFVTLVIVKCKQKKQEIEL